MMMEIMDPREWIKQMIDFQKTTLNNSFNTISIVQTRTEKMTDLFVNQLLWGAEKWKDILTDWIRVCQGGCDNFKKIMNDHFGNMVNNTNKN